MSSSHPSDDKLDLFDDLDPIGYFRKEMKYMSVEVLVLINAIHTLEGDEIIHFFLGRMQ